MIRGDDVGAVQRDGRERRRREILNAVIDSSMQCVEGEKTHGPIGRFAGAGRWTG